MTLCVSRPLYFVKLVVEGSGMFYVAEGEGKLTNDVVRRTESFASSDDSVFTTSSSRNERKSTTMSPILIPNYCDKLRNRKKIYGVDIDFDEASKAWLQNKKKTGNGCYTYTS